MRPVRTWGKVAVMGTETRAMPRMKSFMFFAFFCMDTSIPSIVPSCHTGAGEGNNGGAPNSRHGRSREVQVCTCIACSHAQGVLRRPCSECAYTTMLGVCVHSNVSTLRNAMHLKLEINTLGGSSGARTAAVIARASSAQRHK